MSSEKSQKKSNDLQTTRTSNKVANFKEAQEKRKTETAKNNILLKAKRLGW